MRRRWSLGDERGIALVMVIWVLALMALMAASFLAEARVELRRTGNLRERAVAEALAEAGIHIALARLLADEGATLPQRWTQSLSGGEVAITLTDERGKIDLNEAEPEFLAGLFEGRGVPSRDAAALAAAIVDFRDRDHARSIEGAEDGDYPPGSGGAKDARFESVEELLQVRGMTPSLYRRVVDLVTVHSLLPTIDPLVAGAETLKAVPGIDRNELSRFMTLRAKLEPRLRNAADRQRGSTREEAGTRRAEAYAQLLAAIPARNSVDRWLLTEGSSQRVFTISAEALTATGARYRRDVIARMLEDGYEPLEVLQWRRPQFDG